MERYYRLSNWRLGF